jgi:hypothetical protein
LYLGVYTGIANAKSVDISVEGKTDEIKLRLGSVKNASKPKKYNTKYTVKKPARRVLKTIGKQVSSFRPDLKVGGPAAAPAGAAGTPTASQQWTGSSS